MAIEYNSHGEFTLYRRNNVIIAKLSGVWNKEAALKYQLEFMKLAKPLIGDLWAHLVYLDEWDLGVEEMTPVIQELVEWCVFNGLNCAAHVYSPSTIKQYQLDKMVSQKLGNFEKRVFGCSKEAKYWLKAKGYDVD